MITKQPEKGLICSTLITLGSAILLSGCDNSFATNTLDIASPDVKERNLLEFDIRGISPGMDAQQACDSLVNDFPDVAGLKKKVGISQDSEDWTFREVRPITKGRSYKDGCLARFEGYDLTIKKGSMTEAWIDEVDVDALNGEVYTVHSKQELIVGKTIKDCVNEMVKVSRSLVSKFGEPTKSEVTESHIRLAWDYGLPVTVEDIGKDYRREDYEVNLYCEVYSAAHLSVYQSFFSGDAKKNSYSKLEVKNTFTPST